MLNVQCLMLNARSSCTVAYNSGSSSPQLSARREQKLIRMTPS
ncbi:MAG: hypothetical protein AAF652_01695 [Cyanobacteria bacterium P01_C01_bin.72]